MLDNKLKIIIGSDHAGYKLKDFLKKKLEDKYYKVTDIGTFSEDSMDYPDIAHKVAAQIAHQNFDFGILICGSGNGVAMAANRHNGVRAALCWNEETARLARSHNNAAIICLPARFIDFELAAKLAEIFLTTVFEGGRHLKRVEKIDCF
jgi:ribose 5-phosphate isomerase B